MEHLRELRTEHNVSQQTVAAYLGISRQAYSNYENGHRDPDTETLLKLAEFFDVSVDTLLRGKDSSPHPVQGADLTFDDFSFAMHNHSGELTDKDKEILLSMANQLAEANKRKKWNGETD